MIWMFSCDAFENTKLNIRLFLPQLSPYILLIWCACPTLGVSCAYVDRWETRDWLRCASAVARHDSQQKLSSVQYKLCPTSQNLSIPPPVEPARHRLFSFSEMLSLPQELQRNGSLCLLNGWLLVVIARSMLLRASRLDSLRCAFPCVICLWIDR